MFSINYKITEIETKLYKSCYKVIYSECGGLFEQYQNLSFKYYDVMIKI